MDNTSTQHTMDVRWMYIYIYMTLYMYVQKIHFHIDWKIHIIYLDMSRVRFGLGLGGKGGAEALLKSTDCCDCISYGFPFNITLDGSNFLVLACTCVTILNFTSITSNTCSHAHALCTCMVL